jgi:hypothetical protein
VEIWQDQEHLMDLPKIGISTFLTSALIELTFPGKLATFLGLTLLFWGLASSTTSMTLFGIALLCLALASYYWRRRYVGVQFQGEGLEISWPHFLAGLLFFVAFLGFSLCGLVAIICRPLSL